MDGNHSSTHDYGTKENPNVQALKDYTSSFTEQVMVSYLGRLAYNYKQKYCWSLLSVGMVPRLSGRMSVTQIFPLLPWGGVLEKKHSLKTRYLG